MEQVPPDEGDDDDDDKEEKKVDTPDPPEEGVRQAEHQRESRRASASDQNGVYDAGDSTGALKDTRGETSRESDGPYLDEEPPMVRKQDP